MPLTDTAVRLAKARTIPYRLNDGRGLSLLVQPNGSKWWRFRYKFSRKEKTLSLRVYPDVSLLKARERRDDARKLIADGIDPSDARKSKKQAASDTFERVWQDYLKTLHKMVATGNRSIRTYKKATWMLETFIFPSLGDKPIATITPQMLLVELKKIEASGMHETARRTKQRCGKVFRHGIGLGVCKHDVSTDLRGLLEPPTVKHHASITEPRDIAPLLRAIDAYTGKLITRIALQLAPLLFARPIELRTAEWRHVDMGNGQWRIPMRIMKMGIQHLVPLSSQALKLLYELKPVTGEGIYLFPALGNPQRTMSENTINNALRRLGYSGDVITGQGFRSMASTLLNEHGWNADAIERQLSHLEENEVRAAYNYAQHLYERRLMMQA